MSFRGFFTLSLAGLGMLAFATATGLIVITTLMYHASLERWSAMGEVRLADALQESLLLHHRSLVPASASPLPQSPRSLEAQLQQQLAQVHRLAQTEQEQRLVERLESAINAYMEAYHQTEGLPLEQRGQALSPRLDAALVPLKELETYGQLQVLAAQERVTRWDKVANMAGLSGVLLMMLGGLALLLGLRRFVFHPLLEINTTLRNYGRGNRQARAPETGLTEMREIARTFNDMATSLGRQQEAQLAFLAGVAHDLRNPLSAMKMSAALIHPGRALSQERLDRTLALIHRQVARLDQMIGDLLDATRIEAGQFELHLEERNVCELAREVVELYQSGLPSHVLRLELPREPVVLRCDSARLEQVLHNLVSNALKYSPTGSQVDVRVRSEEQVAVLSVVDRGIGIAAEEMKYLFTPFRRGTSARERAPGVGLGLSVARRIVEAHGGNIEVESQLGHGSAFHVRLPQAFQVASAPEAATLELRH